MLKGNKQPKPAASSKLSSPQLEIVLGKEQSYVQSRNPGEQKWLLAVAVSQKQSGKHDEIAKEILLQCQAKNLDKPSAVALRNELLQG